MASKQYLNNKDLYKEIVYCKTIGKLTPQAEKMFILLANRVASKMHYYTIQDKQDNIQTALLQLLSNWACFDEVKYSNAFAYYTEIAKRGVARSFSNLYKKRGDDNNEIGLVSINSFEAIYI